MRETSRNEHLILWHGGSLKFDSVTEHHRSNCRMHAFWATPDPLVAAVYAGHDGWIQPLSMMPGTVMMDALGGRDGRRCHPMSETHACMATEAAVKAGYHLYLEQGTAWCLHNTEWLNPLLEDEGDYWEAFLDQDIEPQVTKTLLMSMGYQAVLCHDPTEGIDDDVYRRMCGHHARHHLGIPDLSSYRQSMAFHDALAEPDHRFNGYRTTRQAMHMVRTRKDYVPVVGILEPHVVTMHSDAVRALDVMESELDGAPFIGCTDIQALVDSCMPFPLIGETFIPHR